MPEHELLQKAARFVIDLAAFCSAVKPALFTIADFVLVSVGLMTIVYLSLRAH